MKDPAKPLNDALAATPWYGAAVFGPGVTPHFVELGSAATIDALCKEFRTLVAKRNAAVVDPDARLEVICKELHSLLVTPFDTGLSPASHLMLSPDGILHFLPFGALLDPDGTPLLAKRPFSLVSSFRMQEASAASPFPKTGTILLVGGVDYAGSTAGENGLASRGESRLGLSGGLNSIPAAFVFKPLPGTSAEVERIAKMFAEKSWNPISLTGQEVTEGTLSKVEKPTLIHLATHGYFLDVSDTTSDITSAFRRKLVDPMAFAGIALSGAQPTLEAWRQGTVPPLSNDGLLLASELATRNLSGVELLVLSACDTAVGELKDGESVEGFAKACAQAGVKQSLLTLWPISDQATVAIMEGFYQKLLDGNPANEALRSAQLAAFNQEKAAHGLRTAIYTALPFVMIQNHH